MSVGAKRYCLGVFGAAFACVFGAQAVMAGPPLRRDLEAFHLFAMHDLNVKNYTLNGACNIGVNCEQPSTNSNCGVHSGEDINYDEGSQLAADVTKFTKPGGFVWQVFSNQVVSPQNVTIGLPPVEQLTLPILDDLDGDGKPSCQTVGQQCDADSGDLRAACGMVDPPPPCEISKPVLVQPNSDCLIADDEVPGNSRCDLKAGVYGTITVQNGGKLDFREDAGDNAFRFCNFLVGKSTEITATDAVVVSVTGDLNINNDSLFGPGPGEDCGQIVMHVYGPGEFAFGRNSSINGFFCAPDRVMRIGHNNNLTGRFFGDEVSADSNDRGFCCAAGACACFNSFSPLSVAEGGTLTLNGSCSLAAIDEVEIVCGPITADCPITSQTPDEVKCTVPVIAGVGPHVCQVRVASPNGLFTATGSLTVND